MPRAPVVLPFSIGESRTAWFDCAAPDAEGDVTLAPDETISSVGTVASNPTGLTLGSATVNAAVQIIKGRTVAIGQAVSFTVSAASAIVSTKYDIYFYATTSLGNVIRFIGTIKTESF